MVRNNVRVIKIPVLILCIVDQRVVDKFIQTMSIEDEFIFVSQYGDFCPCSVLYDFPGFRVFLEKV